MVHRLLSYALQRNLKGLDNYLHNGGVSLFLLALVSMMGEAQ